MKYTRFQEKYYDEHPPRDPMKLDLDFVYGAYVPPLPRNSFACEKCVYGTGQHREDCAAAQLSVR